MTSATNARNKVFISYSHDDAEWLRCVRTHLRPLERALHLDINVWDDSEIPAGDDWRRQIAGAVASARVIVLLVSPHFLDSDFIANEEIPLLEAARRDGATILPLIISHSRFAKTPGLSHLQTVNDPATPLINMTQGEQDKVFVKLADAVELAFTQQPPLTPHAAANRQTAHTLRELPHVKTALDELKQTLRDKFREDLSLYEPAALVAESVLIDGLRAVARRAHPKSLARHLNASLAEAQAHVRIASRPLGTKELKSQLLRYAAAGDAEIYRLSEKALNTDSFNHSVWVEHGRLYDEVVVKPGIRLKSGYLGHDFVPDAATAATVLDNVFLLINGETIGSAYFLKSVLHPLFATGLSGPTPRDSLVIIADGFQGEALRAVCDATNGGVVTVKTPFSSFSDRCGTLLEDIAILTGGSVLTTYSNVARDASILNYLGRADRVIVTDSETFIIGPRGDSERLRQRLDEIRGLIPTLDSEYDREKLQEHLERLAGGVTIVRVGGRTDEERQRKVEAFNRVLKHYEAAYFSGVVAGEHLAPANAAGTLRSRRVPEEQKQTDVILSDALEAPLRRMAEDFGRDGEETLRAIRSKQREPAHYDDYRIGYYGEEDSFVDLFEAGAIVPAESVVTLMQEAVEAATQRLAALRFTDEVVREVAALEGR